jgi:hypothetical protein
MGEKLLEQNPLVNTSGVIFFEPLTEGFRTDYLERLTYLYSEEALSELSRGSSTIPELNLAFRDVSKRLSVVICVTNTSAIVSRA